MEIFQLFMCDFNASLFLMTNSKVKVKLMHSRVVKSAAKSQTLWTADSESADQIIDHMDVPSRESDASPEAKYDSPVPADKKNSPSLIQTRQTQNGIQTEISQKIHWIEN